MISAFDRWWAAIIEAILEWIKNEILSKRTITKMQIRVLYFTEKPHRGEVR